MQKIEPGCAFAKRFSVKKESCYLNEKKQIVDLKQYLMELLHSMEYGARRFISGWKSGTLPPSIGLGKQAYSVFNRPLPKSTDMV